MIITIYRGEERVLWPMVRAWASYYLRKRRKNNPSPFGLNFLMGYDFSGIDTSWITNKYYCFLCVFSFEICKM